MKPFAIICDIDGTLAKKGTRNAFDWENVGKDYVNVPVARLLQIMSKKYKIIIVSGRDSVCRVQTEKWLKQCGFPIEALYMRPEGDNRKDSIIKEEIYLNHIKKKYYIEFVLDDRDQVVELWRKKLGLVCFQVDYGDF